MSVHEIRRRLEHDLAAEGVRRPVTIDQVDADDPEVCLAVRLTYGPFSWREVWLVHEQDVEEQVAAVADALQDDLADQHDLIVWPTCPGHPHQPRIDRVDGRATWLCPKTFEILAPIGELEGPPEG